MNSNSDYSPKFCDTCGSLIPSEAHLGLCPRCALAQIEFNTQSDAPAPPALPSLERLTAAFPQLEILSLIGRGGMGAVYKARQPNLDRYVALKLLPRSLAADPGFAVRFHREAKFLAQLNHPNIVSVYDFGETEECHFLIMEYVDRREPASSHAGRAVRCQRGATHRSEDL